MLPRSFQVTSQRLLILHNQTKSSLSSNHLVNTLQNTLQKRNITTTLTQPQRQLLKSSSTSITTTTTSLAPSRSIKNSTFSSSTQPHRNNLSSGNQPYSWTNQETQYDFIVDSKYVQMRQDLDNQIKRGPINNFKPKEKTSPSSKYVQSMTKGAFWLALKTSLVLAAIPTSIFAGIFLYQRYRANVFYEDITAEPNGLSAHLNTNGMTHLLSGADISQITQIPISVNPESRRLQTDDPLLLQPFLLKHYLIGQELAKRTDESLDNLYKLQLLWSNSTAESVGTSQNDYISIKDLIQFFIAEQETVLFAHQGFAPFFSFYFLSQPFLSQSTLFQALCHRHGKQYTLGDFDNIEAYNAFFHPDNNAKYDLQYTLNEFAPTLPFCPSQYTQGLALQGVFYYGELIERMQLWLRLNNATSLYLASNLNPDWRTLTPKPMQHLYGLYNYIQDVHGIIPNRPVDNISTGLNITNQPTTQAKVNKFHFDQLDILDRFEKDGTPPTRSSLLINSPSLAEQDIFGLNPPPIFQISPTSPNEQRQYEFTQNLKHSTKFRVLRWFKLLSNKAITFLPNTDPTEFKPLVVLDVTRLQSPNRYNYNQEFPPGRFYTLFLESFFPKFFLQHIPFKPLPILPLEQYIEMRTKQRQRTPIQPTPTHMQHGQTPIPTSPKQHADILSKSQSY